MTEEEDYNVQNPYHPTEKEKLAIEELQIKDLILEIGILKRQV